MGNVQGTFPAPRTPDEGLPIWAVVLIAVAAAIIVLWLIALIGLIVYELFREFDRKSGREEDTPGDIPLSPVGQDKRPYHSYEDTFNPDTASTLNFRLKDTDKDATVIANVHGSGDEGEEMVVSGAHVDVRKEKALVLENIYMSENELDQAEPAPAGMEGMILSRPITVQQLGATIKEPQYLENEFRKIPNVSVASTGIPDEVAKKNRYSNVLPAPRTRVYLSEIPDEPYSDYINASFVRGYQGTAKQYIATQGPMENTVDDFWRMIWEQNCECIVMACAFQEKGQDKCFRYWPAQGAQTYGKFEVTVIEQESNPNWSETKMQIKNLESVEVRPVRHFHYTSWPVSGVPKSTQTITDFLMDVKMADSTGPAVVHCSAGVGRTGVLIAIDVGLQAVLQGDTTIDVLRFVSSIRQDRPGAVQTRDQYKFIHEALYNVAQEIGV